MWSPQEQDNLIWTMLSSFHYNLASYIKACDHYVDLICIYPSCPRSYKLISVRMDTIEVRIYSEIDQYVHYLSGVNIALAPCQKHVTIGMGLIMLLHFRPVWDWKHAVLIWHFLVGQLLHRSKCLSFHQHLFVTVIAHDMDHHSAEGRTPSSFRWTIYVQLQIEGPPWLRRPGRP